MPDVAAPSDRAHIWHQAPGWCGSAMRRQGSAARPSTGCFWQPEGDSPSHNQGSHSLKQALLFPLSCFPFPWALLSQPFHLSPGSLGLTTLLLSKPLASLLALPVFIFRGFLLLFLATEAAAAFLQALSLGCCFLGPLDGTARFLGHGLTGTIKCVPASS